MEEHGSTEKRFYIRTYGCQMNDHDSQAMALLLAKEGFLKTGDPAEADIILFNTCTVREKAHHKAMSDIGRARIHKERRQNVRIGITGCVAEQEREGLFKRFGFLDFVLGPDHVVHLAELLRSTDATPLLAAGFIDDAARYQFPDILPNEKVWSGSSFLSIMKGCDCSCSYCIVPSVRGHEVCKTPGDVVKEVKRLVDHGAKEVTLLGQNVTAYREPGGKGGQALAALIERIANETDISRIRFTSPHPKDVDEHLVSLYQRELKLCGHIHLPLQSGSDRILKAMRRGYTRDQYLALVSALRSVRPEISVTTDVIVGFPGETESDFQETLDLMRTVRFDSCFAFAYSPRTGTRAWNLPDDVEKEEKQRRLGTLLTLHREMTREKNRTLVGSVGTVLVTGKDRLRRGRLSGRLDDNRMVHFVGNESLIGEFTEVRIIRALEHSLLGEEVHEKG